MRNKMEIRKGDCFVAKVQAEIMEHPEGQNFMIRPEGGPDVMRCSFVVLNVGELDNGETIYRWCRLWSYPGGGAAVHSRARISSRKGFLATINYYKAKRVENVA